MRKHRILALIVIGSLTAWGLAGTPPSKSSSSRPSSHSTGSSHATPSPSHTSGGHASSSTSKSTGSSVHQSTGSSSHQTISTTSQFKNGPHPPGPHVLGTEMLAHASRMEHHFHRHEWHRWHHWHHHWIWGAVVFLPVSHSGLVTAVPNGNTLSVMNAANVPRRVRLAGVAAPVAGQGFFSESQHHLAALALNKHVRVFSVGADADGTTVARVFLRDGTYLNERQLRDGMAWNLADDGFDGGLGSAEQVAMAARAGLWTQNLPLAPWLATP
jgi:micrococcal nuclease